MKTRGISLDFVPQRRSRLLGSTILMIGTAALLWTISGYQDIQTEMAIVEMQMPSRATGADNARSRPIDERSLRAAQQAVFELAIPWSTLFAELEEATQLQMGNIALLRVEPDTDNGRVRVAAEARSLDSILEYVKSLQHSTAVQLPILDLHEIRTRERERPVYFELTADWRLTP